MGDDTGKLVAGAGVLTICTGVGIAPDGVGVGAGVFCPGRGVTFGGTPPFAVIVKLAPLEFATTFLP